MTRWESLELGNGGRVQSGTPSGPRRGSNGLLLRGAVTATYLIDDDSHPEKRKGSEPVAVYCDVMTYSSMSTQRFSFLPKVLVSQEIGHGMQRGRVWQPRAATLDKTNEGIDYDNLTNLGELDGDHVLVGFMDDSLHEPVILRGIPHPSADVGNEENIAGRRLRLVDGDGDPDLHKHHGSFYGIDTDGGFQIDTRFANDGELLVDGKEKAPSGAFGAGDVILKLPLSAAHQVGLYDMADPDNPELKVEIAMDQNLWRIRFVDEETKIQIDKNTILLDVKNGANPIKIVDGQIELGGTADRACLDSFVQDNFDRVENDINDLRDEVGRHFHPLDEFPFPLMFADILAIFRAPLVYTVQGQKPINIRTGSEQDGSNAPMDITGNVGEYIPDPFLPPDSGVFVPASSPTITESDLVTIES